MYTTSYSENLGGDFMNLKKSLIIGASVLTLAPVASATFVSSHAYANEVAPEAPIERFFEDDSIHAVGLTNQMLFDELETQGYDLHDIYTDEEIEMAIAEDNSPFRAAGKTQMVSTGENTWTLYLNSTYVKTIASLGQGAIAIISGLLGGVGVAGLSTFLGSMASEFLDTDKGVYINFKNQNIPGGLPQATPISWGYQ